MCKIPYLIHKQSLPTKSIQLEETYLPTNHTWEDNLLSENSVRNDKGGTITVKEETYCA